jgi:DNA-binding transcriptional ArsR family regulator
MTVNAKLLSILRTLAESPRGVKWLSANGYGTPAAVQFNLLALADMGYADAPDRVSRMSTCSFWISDKGRQYLADLKPAESRSFVQRGPYVPGKWTPARAGADNHFAHRSHGLVRV